jgi:ribosomal protein L35
MKGMKTNKAFLKRLKITRNGKIIARKAGQNHFNAKESRRTQLRKGRTQGLPETTITSKVAQRYIPN